MNEKLQVNNVNKIKREYPNKNNIEGSNKQPDNMLSMLQIFFFDQKILTDKSKKRVLIMMGSIKFDYYIYIFYIIIRPK